MSKSIKGKGKKTILSLLINEKGWILLSFPGKLKVWDDNVFLQSIQYVFSFTKPIFFIQDMFICTALKVES